MTKCFKFALIFITFFEERDGAITADVGWNGVLWYRHWGLLGSAFWPGIGRLLRLRKVSSN